MNNKKIFLLGDVVRHVYLKIVDETDKADKADEKNTRDEKKGKYKVFTQKMESTRKWNKVVCPPIIKEMIVKAIGGSKDEVVPEYEFKRQPDVPSLNLFRVLRKFPRKSNQSDDDMVYRVDQAAEYFGSELSLVPSKKLPADKLKAMKQLFSKSYKTIKPELLVLYDRNSDLCSYIKKEYSDNQDVQDKLKTLFDNTEKAIVISIKENIKDNEWLEILSKLAKDKKDRCIVIITADDLRHAGLDITEYGAIEQQVREIVGYLNEEPLNKIWDKLCEHLVVIFRENQVLYINTAYGSYHVCPYFDRPAQMRPEQYGKMPGKFTIQVASIVKYLYLCEDPFKTGAIDKVIAKALRFGVVVYNRYFYEGYCANIGSTPFDALNAAIDKLGEGKLYQDSWQDKGLYVSSLYFNINQIKHDIAKHNGSLIETTYNFIKGARSDLWSRSDALFEKNDNERSVLHKIVKNGLESVTLKQDEPNDFSVDSFSDYKIICPHLEVGDMKIIDEVHMKGFIDLAQLFRNYLSPHNKSEQPLCIAVFGDPGEGKNYSIKQILKHVSPERKSEELTFNLAQFNSVEQLTEAFHQTQDRVLKQHGEPPLIIFDEFDAKFGRQELGWLKYFLAPMQDDLFYGKSGNYKVGRAIFVFSGGTSKCFSDFEEKLKNRQHDRQAVKLNDFIGRLRGFMDVKGVNSNDGDISRIVKLRRAIVLRSLLKKHAKPIFSSDRKARIHDHVIDALLDTKKYHFGVRSMEAIIQMSRWIDKEFEPSSLPSLEQLEIHVDTEAFQKILVHNKN